MTTKNSWKRCFCLFGLLCSPFLVPQAEGKSPQSIPFELEQRSAGSVRSPQQLSAEVEARLFAESNQARAKKNLTPFSSDPLLEQTARDHSLDMLKRNYLSHFSPQGKAVVDRYQKNSRELDRSLGENLHTITSSEGLQDPQAIASQMMEDWMHSASHRKNILSKDFSFLGVACESDGQRIFCTQVFGGPRQEGRGRIKGN